MRSFAMLLAATLLATPAFCQSAVPAAAAQSPEDKKLLQLFHDSDEAMLKRQPLQALVRGDLRYADRLGDFFSDKALAEGKAADESDLKTLATIDRSKLNPTDRIAYDVFKWQTDLDLRSYAPDILKETIERPIDHFNGIHIFYPDIASGQGAAPFNTVADYENNLKRHQDFIRNLDEAIVRFRQGMKDGIVQPKLVVNNVIDQLDQQIAAGVEGSPYYGPVKKFPAGIPAADQARLTNEYADTIRTGIIPAETRLRDFLKTEYLPHARDAVGLSAMPGGAKLYAYLIESNTTLPLTAEYVHNLGLSEVARDLKEMEVQKEKVGFKGTLPQFFDYLRTDPRFQPKSAQELHDTYMAIRQTVLAHVPEQFSLVPKSPLDIRATPDYREKTSAGGDYSQGTPDGSRPGVFYYNTYDLPSRYNWETNSLFLHEAIPGHHFQISIAQENASLPAFMRFGGNTAYVEGWALYSETLWGPMGLETDPYQRMGGLSDDMLRAMRLVVDSGIHAMGWTRDQSIAYMLANSPMSKTDATAEVERYIAIPGQALAYKIGQLTILKEKAKAQAALGSKFDPRAFHAQVLDTGALPMSVLEKKIDTWIETQKGK
ncbi:DUF885 domain-containing protein [Sphingomonas sp. CGMCC 1.13654]|uniref:DUF885 domain-containing protein n=1 Tax=Sphingomonas chungangi TaxID=2683589 RepID=A0A838L601_9SPHN|nr:DUF885 domain-containing protein [Sphingomonas chungangi]MBA2934042.1 DUF885 domain-containing protein [Sphingomonas chungangi]MVW57788.1 DUF885 family protein [Sphingomonas chungangi]